MPGKSESNRSVRRSLGLVRGYAGLATAGALLLVSDVLQRTVVAGAARLFPRSRQRILTVWIQAMRAVVLDLGSVMIGGARLAPHPRIPSRPGVLVIMNHQSLLDIPLVVRALEGNYPRIVTRQRYTKGIPLISHMVRLYQYPLVDPEATARGQLRGLEEAARDGEGALVIFPEGTRTRTGQLGPWKRSGLRTLLSVREWEVYVAVADGLWQARSLSEFIECISTAEIHMTHRGPFAWAPDSDQEAFIAAMRVHMEESLLTLRSGAA